MGQGALGLLGAAPLGASDGPLPAQPLPIQKPQQHQQQQLQDKHHHHQRTT
jgi:hypothetical protein